MVIYGQMSECNWVKIPLNSDLYHTDYGLCLWMCSGLWIHFVYELLRTCLCFLIWHDIINSCVKLSFPAMHCLHFFLKIACQFKAFKLPTHEFLQLLHMLNIYNEPLCYFADMCLLGLPLHSKRFSTLSPNVQQCFSNTSISENAQIQCVLPHSGPHLICN